MALNKITEPRSNPSRSLVIAIAVVIILAVGYTIFRTLNVPKHEINHTTQPLK